MMLKVGDKVIMNDKYNVSFKNKGVVFTVKSEPWDCCGTTVALLDNYRGGYAVDGLTLIKENEDKMTYSELRDTIHKILTEFLDYELPLQNDGEFDFEYMEMQTDEILNLIKKQGGSYRSCSKDETEQL